MIPQAGRLYETASLWRGEPYRFTVTFTDRFVTVLRRARATVELAAGELVYESGARRDVCGARAEFERLTGARAPAWLFRAETQNRAFVLPRGGLAVDAEIATGAVVLTPPKACVPIFACLNASYLPRPIRYDRAAFAPLSTACWRPQVRTLMPGLELWGRSVAALDLAEAAFDAVCGRAASAWADSRASLEARRAVAFRLTGELLEHLDRPRRSVDAALDAVGELLGSVQAAELELTPISSLGAARSTKLGAAEAIEALATFRRRLEERVMPIRIVVVPSGAHFSALPEMWALRRHAAGAPVAFDEHGTMVSSNSPLQSATVVTGGCRFVFMPADDLEDMQISSRHELYHLLESQLMTAAHRRRLDAYHAETVARAGPFARPYGFLRQEFLATMGEVYEGAYGDEGIVWLRRYHGELFELLEELTGERAGSRELPLVLGGRR